VIPRIAITSGEPAGIGPDLCLAVSGIKTPAELVLIGDPELFKARAVELAYDITLPAYQAERPARAGCVCIEKVPYRVASTTSFRRWSLHRYIKA
jgi:4-hydroxythreonine-4-phosphate dehydrogenase